MNYEIVTLKEKTVVGLSARTNNQSPDMGAVIGGLWEQFYSETVYPNIKRKMNQKSLGIYSDYENDEKSDYTITVACEVDSAVDLPENTTATTIPAGKYAKFVVIGHMQQAVAQFWEKLWDLDLDRTYTYDFEEYQNADMEQAIIHIYISIK